MAYAQSLDDWDHGFGAPVTGGGDRLLTRRQPSELGRRRTSRASKGVGDLLPSGTWIRVAAGRMAAPPVPGAHRAVYAVVHGRPRLLAVTVFAASVGFYWTYKTVAEIRLSRGLASDVPANSHGRFELTQRMLWLTIVLPLTAVSLGISLLFARPGKPFFVCSLPIVSGMFDPATARWFGMEYWPAVCFGGLVGLIRAAHVHLD